MKKKEIIMVIMFSIIIVSGGLMSILTPDTEISLSERRRLAEKPQISAQGVLSGDYFTKLDSYLTDSFTPRETWRRIKALTEVNIFGALDLDGIYITQGSAVEMEYPLNERMVFGFTEKINAIADNLLKPDQRVFYSVIPDKNYYFSKESGRLAMDYDRLLAILTDQFADMEYIDLFPTLTGMDYYATDSHWRQERLYGVTEALAIGMGFPNPFPVSFIAHEFSPFFGVYYGQTALPLGSDTIIYLETDYTKSASVSHAENGKGNSVYDLSRLASGDPFDLFLSGATALCSISNYLPRNNSELIIFRDSFSSALAPLLLPAYDKITLIDIRYISPALLTQYVDFAGQDVLFLFSSTMINNSAALRAF